MKAVFTFEAFLFGVALLAFAYVSASLNGDDQIIDAVVAFLQR
jgi:hypothetical protein